MAEENKEFHFTPAQKAVIRRDDVEIKRVNQNGTYYITWSNNEGTFKRVKWRPSKNRTLEPAKRETRSVENVDLGTSKNYKKSFTIEAKGDPTKSTESYAELKLVAEEPIKGFDLTQLEDALDVVATEDEAQFWKDFKEKFVENGQYSINENSGETSEKAGYLYLEISYASDFEKDMKWYYEV